MNTQIVTRTVSPRISARFVKWSVAIASGALACAVGVGGYQAAAGGTTWDAPRIVAAGTDGTTWDSAPATTDGTTWDSAPATTDGTTWD
ncbi:hypothetical protein GCM10009530_60340 [Microbispora corallina]|uniref:Uncharacterized protein n=1 Tax=Microbispora corallina TaxID=83302 RepID=A0ABQ4FZ16_9ACTN|nr:hypothetical protein [Microbispora corallina]GIH40020.1 hypothetical protein Mco01_30200 [Microbispora corallina]